MGIDFDIKGFVEDMRACKPPYKCPFPDCGKVYKSFPKMHTHLNSHQFGGEAGAGSGSRTPASAGGRGSPAPAVPCFRSPLKDSVTYIDAEKCVEFETPDGQWHKLDIYQALDVVSKEDWEASLPDSFHQEEERRKKEEAEAAAAKAHGHHGGATPKTPAHPPGRSSSGRGRGGRKGFTPRRPGSAQARCQSPAVEGGSRDKGGGEGGDVSETGGGGGGESNGPVASDGGKKMIKLPEAQYFEIDDYEIDNAPPMPSSFYRFIEKSIEEQDEEVEYDMDEEDVAWLNIINEKRSSENLSKISEDNFELLMDRLEKESYFHVQSNGSKDFAAPIDEDAICCVCMDGECSNTNVILFCDLCNLAVHQECYGVPYIPEGQWLCRRCLQSPSRSVECCLCPNRGGAFKQTDDGRWAHVVCGLWIPEVRFANTVFLEPIDSIDNIPPARWKLSCRVCKQRGVGACIQCHKTNCYTAFHVTCGLLAGLHMKMDTVREPSAAGSLSVTVRKTAYCDVHTPLDSDCKPKLDDVAALGISTPKQKGGQKGEKGAVVKKQDSPVPVLFRGLMNFSPQCPWEKVQEIASLISVQQKQKFFQRLMAYWTLKRQTRNGVPLIRRLQFAKASRTEKGAPETPQKNAHHSREKKEREKEAAKKARSELSVLNEQRRSMRHLRHDLERVRLLCELIRKREQRKRELIVNKSQITALRCAPLAYFMGNVLDCLRDVDTQDIFQDPVSIEDVPDYFEHVKVPMDISSMRKKLEGFHYLTMDDLEADFEQMVANCLSYNERDTIFFRAGVKMRDQGGQIIRQARRMIEEIGFDPKTGLHLQDEDVKNVKKEEFSDEKLMQEIDGFLSDDEEGECTGVNLDDHLKRLLDLHDKALMLHHPVAKGKRVKALKQEIIKVRRKMSMDKAGTSPGFKPRDGAASPATGVTPVRKKKAREVSPTPLAAVDIDTPTGRRLRTGREVVSGSEGGGRSSPEPSPSRAKPGPSKQKGQGKRPRTVSSGLDDGDVTPSSQSPAQKKSKTSDTPSTPASSGSPKTGVTSSPGAAGVNRRNAVLFTRKKQAAGSNPADTEKSEEAPSTPTSKSKPKSSSKKVLSSTDDNLANIETEVRSPPPPPPPPDSADENIKAATPSKAKKKVSASARPPPKSPPKSAKKTSATGGSFGSYRRGGDMPTETDEDTVTDSDAALAVAATSEDGDDSDLESDSDSEAEERRRNAVTAGAINMEPLDLVWAKCRGYPWYPALIINPKMPRTGYLHNGVPIPVPPQDVLDMASTHTTPHFLILFFDSKRTWQWLQRDGLEPLGVHFELDKSKLVQSKKATERKSVRKAYEDAVQHRCRVTGENNGPSAAGQSEESSGTEKD